MCQLICHLLCLASCEREHRVSHFSLSFTHVRNASLLRCIIREKITEMSLLESIISLLTWQNPKDEKLLIVH